MKESVMITARVKSTVSFVILLQLILIPTISYGVYFSMPIPILDKAQIVQRESPEFGPWKDIEVQGYPKKESILKSTAKLTQCAEFRPKVLRQNINEALKVIRLQKNDDFYKPSNLFGIV
jgi:hypothetical protein